jgi:CubicO group peptidase (beta-lactamase class C family)
MLLNGGELDGARLLSPKTLQLMTANHLPGGKGDFFWGGAASTFFWVDPVEDLTVVFMTQLLPSSAYAVRRELRTLVYSAFTEAAG